MSKACLFKALSNVWFFLHALWMSDTIISFFDLIVLAGESDLCVHVRLQKNNVVIKVIDRTYARSIFLGLFVDSATILCHLTDSLCLC